MTSKTKKWKGYETISVRPEGWINYLVFEFGRFSCGAARDGISVCVSEDGLHAPSGVLKNSDTKKIVNAMRRHLKSILPAKRSKSKHK